MRGVQAREGTQDTQGGHTVNIGQPKKVVRVKEPAVPYKGDEVVPERAPERAPERVPELVPAFNPKEA